jgi:hypothetical protein
LAWTSEEQFVNACWNAYPPIVPQLISGIDVSEEQFLNMRLQQYAFAAEVLMSGADESWAASSNI